MTRANGVKPARRTQEQRSADMRNRLLDATIDCLVEYGFSGTTTPRVAEMAGVTRGAQVHHYPSKTDLVIAAIRHLAAKRAEAAIAEIGALESVDDPAAKILELLWDLHNGPIFVATVELWVAGRTDPTLAHEMAKFEPLVATNILTALAQGLPGQESNRQLRDFIYTAMDAIRGILISNFVEPDPTRARRRWDRAVASLRASGEEAFAST